MRSCPSCGVGVCWACRAEVAAPEHTCAKGAAGKPAPTVDGAALRAVGSAVCRCCWDPVPPKSAVVCLACPTWVAHGPLASKCAAAHPAAHPVVEVGDVAAPSWAALKAAQWSTSAATPVGTAAAEKAAPVWRAAAREALRRVAAEPLPWAEWRAEAGVAAPLRMAAGQLRVVTPVRFSPGDSSPQCTFDAAGRTMRCGSGEYHAVVGMRCTSGVAEWGIRFRDDERGNEGTCLGISQLPAADKYNVRGSRHIVWRAWNGARYIMGDELATPALPKLNPGMVIRFRLDLSARRLTATVDAGDVLVVNAAVPPGEWYPVVITYGTHAKEYELLECTIMSYPD